MRRVALSAVVVLALVGGCTSSEGATTTSTEAPVTTSPVTTSPVTTSPVTTSPADEATTTTIVTTTTEAPATTAADPVFGTEPPLSLKPPAPLDGSDGAAGSGCSPGTPITDGVWFGYVHNILPSSIEIDLACFWFGDIAYEVGEADGEEVANNYYVQNRSDRRREVPVAADVIVWSLAGDTTEGHSPIRYDEWPVGPSTYVPCPGEACGVWIYLNDGSITEIVEQYVP